MTVSVRDIEKLEAIGYYINSGKNWHSMFSILKGWRNPDYGTEVVGHGNHADTCYGDGLQRICGKECDKDGAWAMAKEHAQSPEGMKVTMADKIRWLNGHGPGSAVFIAISSANGEGIATSFSASMTYSGGRGDSPESAVDALFWKVP